MRYSSIPSAFTVVQHCKARNIAHIVISPGSRNAPLTLGFAEDPFFTCYSIVDERSAAFFALGIAQQLQQAVAVVCTSGSALLNYYPAVAEAFYSDIPLVVISADRPPYKIDIGDGQTIRQDHVFYRHIGLTALLKQDVTHATSAIKNANPSFSTDEAVLKELQKEIQDYNEDALNRTLQWALLNKGPVHINVPMEEPLYHMEQDSILSPRIGALDAPPKGSIQEMAEFGDIWNHCKRKMVIIGSATPGLLGTEDVALLAADPSVLVFTETTSNCHHPNFFPSIDSIVAPIEKSKDKETLFERLQPELLITMGGMVVSKKIKAFLRAYRPKHHWHIDSRRCYDTYFSLTRHFRCTPDEFFREFKPCIHTGDSNYREQWEEVRERYRLKRKEYLGQIEFSDMLVFYHIQTTIPQNNYVQLANSSTVRYSQLFEMHPSLKVFCNRGTSGIDGSTSTAVGASLLVESPTVLISGDLSFLYDSNGLWNNYLRPDFRIILINNKGGGIFRILPGAEESDTFETFFETTQDLDISKLCDFYGLEHFTAANETQLSVILSRFYEPSEQPRLLEVQTPRVVNNKILLTYFDFLS